MGRYDTAYDGTDPNYYDHQLAVLDESAGRGRYDNELASLDARFGRGALGQGAVSEPQPEAQYQQQPLPPFQSPQMSPYQPSPPPQMPSPPQPEAQYQQQPLPPFDPQPMSPYQPSPQAMPQFPPRPRQLYSGDTMSPEFYDGLSFDDPTVVSPRQVMEDGYGSPELFDQSLAKAQSYREDNPDLSWVQNLDDETLDSRISVRSREEGGGGYYGGHSVKLGEGQSAPYLQAALQHEVGGHGTQGLNTEGNPSPMYPPGVGFDGVQEYDREAALAEGMRTSPSYQFQRIETEARMRGYQQDARKSFEGGYGAYPEDPKNSRTYLEELLYGRQSPYGDEGLDHGAGLPETFQNMPPEEQEEFLDYWGPRMPGLVQNGNLGMYGSVG